MFSVFLCGMMTCNFVCLYFLTWYYVWKQPYLSTKMHHTFWYVCWVATQWVYSILSICLSGRVIASNHSSVAICCCFPYDAYLTVMCFFTISELTTSKIINIMTNFYMKWLVNKLYFNNICSFGFTNQYPDLILKGFSCCHFSLKCTLILG